MIRPIALLVFASFATTAACTMPPAATPTAYAQLSGPQCFRANDLRGFSAGPDGLVNVQTAGNRWFEMRLSRGCPGFEWIMKIGIRPMESSWLCEGKADEIIAPHPGGPDRCYVSEIQAISPGGAS